MTARDAGRRAADQLVSLAGELQRDWARPDTAGTVYEIVIADRLAQEQ